MTTFINRLSQILWMAVLAAALLVTALVLGVLGFTDLALVFAVAGVGAAILNLGSSN